MSSDNGDLLWINVGKPDDIKRTGIKSSISSHAMRTAVRLSRGQSGSSESRRKSAKSKAKSGSRQIATAQGSERGEIESSNNDRPGETGGQAFPRTALVRNQRAHALKRMHSAPEEPNDDEDNEWMPLPYQPYSPRPKKALESPLFPQRLGQYIFRYLTVCK